MNLKKCILLSLGLTIFMPLYFGQAAVPIETQEQLNKSRQQQEERNTRLGEERIEWHMPFNINEDGSQRKSETETQSLQPSFYISQIRLAEEYIEEPLFLNTQRVNDNNFANGDNSTPVSQRLIKGPLAQKANREVIVLDVPEEFSFLRKCIKPYINHKVSIDDINALSSKLNQELIFRGYITSKVGIPIQSLKEGQLQFNLQIGRVESIKYADGTPHLPWQNAFPLRAGDILNIREIEQGVEQMRRLNSQSIKVELEAGSMPLYSKIILKTEKKPPIHGLLAIDDSGLKATGKLQWIAVISADRIFNANDNLQISVNQNAEKDNDIKGTKSHSIAYFIPRGKDTFSFRYSQMNYYQTVSAVPISFKSSSRVKSFNANWNHVFHRDRTTKRSLDISFAKRNSKNYINDMEIVVQKGNTANFEVGISERRYIKQNTLFSRFAIKKGVGWFGSQPEYSNGAPSTRFTQFLFDIDYQIPRTWGHRPGSFTMSFHGQWTTGGKRLFSRDMISIGNRYTVRGFDGEYTLMSESGWYMRNEISSYIPKLKTSVYMNLDFGAVYGPSTDILIGKFIVGTALGVRGELGSSLFYDGFIGTSLYKPDGYYTDDIVTGFQAGVRF